MNTEPVVSLAGTARLRGVNPHPYSYFASFRPIVVRKRPLRLDRGPRGLVRAAEGEEEGIALVVDFLAAVVLRGRAQDPPVLREDFAVLRAKPLQESRGPLDVGEEE